MAITQVKDVAARAGVSPATVSNALNHPEKVSPATRDRVEAAIRELGYVRNDAARQLRQRQNRAVGMIVLDVANPFFADVAQGAEEYLENTGRPLLLGNSAQLKTREKKHLRWFEEQRVAGLLISPVGDVLPKLRRIKDRGTAVVIVDRKTGASDFSSVSADDKLGGRLVAEHLVMQGRTRLLVAGGPFSIRQVAHRYAGVEQYVRSHPGVGLEFFDTGAMNIASGRRAAKHILEKPIRSRPDSLFATNDLVALGALQELNTAGVRIPEDIALIGYDDIQFSGSATVPISSVRQPTVEMGQKAAELLCKTIDDPGAKVEHPVFVPKLIPRRSTARQ